MDDRSKTDYGRPMDIAPAPKESKHSYKIDQTFFSDGTRIITIKYQSYEGERKILKGIEKLMEDYNKEA